MQFQSTPSVGRATSCVTICVSSSNISIHALRGEGDVIGFFLCNDFLQISIHALRGEGDQDLMEVGSNEKISIHALRGEGD